MKISAGKKIIDYAMMVGAEIDEVVRWVSGYVNGPWSDSMTPYMEKTEELRLKSIQDYINLRLDMSVKSNIQSDLLMERIETRESKPCTDLCPF
jgi:hypothetical protein